MVDNQIWDGLPDEDDRGPHLVWSRALPQIIEEMDSIRRPPLRLTAIAVPQGFKIPRHPPNEWRHAFNVTDHLLGGGLLDMPMETAVPATLTYLIYTPFRIVTDVKTAAIVPAAQSHLGQLTALAMGAAVHLSTVESSGFAQPCRWTDLVSAYLHHAWAGTDPKLSADRDVAYKHANGLEGARHVDFGSDQDDGDMDARLFPHLFYCHIDDLVRDLIYLLRLMPSILGKKKGPRDDGDADHSETGIHDAATDRPDADRPGVDASDG